MEIKRRTEITIATRKRLFVRQTAEQKERIFCEECGETTLSAEVCADVFSVSRREIYRLVEAGKADFVETDAGVLLVCPNSFTGIPEGEDP